MKFYEFDEKEKRVDIFNERFYRRDIDGSTKWYRNVTTILGIISKGYQFDEWLKNNGHNTEIILDRAGRFGTMFHGMVETFLKGGTVNYYDYNGLGEQVSTSLWERFSLWHDFWVELNAEHEVTYKPEGIEYIVYNDQYEYAGTVDFICRIDGELQIFDWKTSNNIYNSYHQQMIAYMNPLGIKKANLAWFPASKPNKKGYRIIPVEYSEEKFDLFIATKKVFDSENKDEPKFLTLPLTYTKEQ